MPSGWASALSLGALSAELNPVVCSRNFLENAPCIGFLHFFVLVPNSPFNAPWDYLLNVTFQTPASQSLSHCLLPGTLLGDMDLLTYSPTSCTVLSALHRLCLAWQGLKELSVSPTCLSIQTSPWLLGHLNPSHQHGLSVILK